jgi:hypothetical protein
LLGEVFNQTVCNFSILLLECGKMTVVKIEKGLFLEAEKLGVNVESACADRLKALKKKLS